jgi:hypothetical protein
MRGEQRFQSAQRHLIGAVIAEPISSNHGLSEPNAA